MYKDGKKLSLPLMTTAGNKTRELVQSFLQKEWKSIGIDVPIKNQPAKVYFGETVKKVNTKLWQCLLGYPLREQS